MGINDVYVTKEYNGQEFTSKLKCELYNDHFENAKRYNIPHAQLIIADIPYNLGNNEYYDFIKDCQNNHSSLLKYMDGLKIKNKKNQLTIFDFI